MDSSIWAAGMPGRPLRLGLMVPAGHDLENWQLMLVDRIFDDPRFELDLVIADARPPPARASDLFKCIRTVDEALFARQRNYPVENTPAQFKMIRVVELNEGRERELAPDIESGRIDLVLRHSSIPLPKSLLATLPFGEWSFSFCDDSDGVTDWAGFEAAALHAPLTSFDIAVRTHDDPRPRVFASAGYNTKFSAARNSAFLKEKSVAITMRELRRLADSRETPEGAPSRSPPHAPPDRRQAMRYGLALSRAAISRAVKTAEAKLKIRPAIWTLFSGQGSVERFDPSLAYELPPSRSEIKADPFLFSHEGATYLFYECYSWHDRKAHIAVSRFDGDHLTPLGPALKSKHHLSYPFVFGVDDAVFMMPETHAANRLEVWRCVEFPKVWELHATAFEGKSLVDSTLVRHKGEWWLFTNLSDHHAFADHCSELYAFRVDGPELTSIEPHRLNPIVVGSDRARNAGRILETPEGLFRPSQNNSHGVYGYGLNIMKIEELSLDAYRETLVRAIEPDFKPELFGCHHFDLLDGRYVVDARRNV